MKKFLIATVSALTIAASALSLTACGGDNKIYVDTNAFFAPFEYYGGAGGTEIVGVDVEIMNKVGEKLGKEVVFENTDFDVIIDNVASGKKYDCGAAGITITDERQAKVDFSNPYFTTVQYAIFKNSEAVETAVSTDGTSTEHVLWSQLKGKKIGVQRDTTGDIFAADELSTYEKDDGSTFVGELYDADVAATYSNAEAYSNAFLKKYDSAQLAVDAMGADQIDVVIVDKLPAQYITLHNNNYKCYALYYDAETATTEDYAICVTKGNNELLNAINAVLAELGENGINALVQKHLGLGE